MVNYRQSKQFIVFITCLFTSIIRYSFYFNKNKTLTYTTYDIKVNENFDFNRNHRKTSKLQSKKLFWFSTTDFLIKNNTIERLFHIQKTENPHNQIH